MTGEIVDPWFRTYWETDGVTVVHVDLTPDKDREAHAYEWLDIEERNRWRRFRFDRPKREFALCRAALRFGVCTRLGCSNDQLTFGVSKYGKPFGLVDGNDAPIKFNVSHGGKHGLIAYSRHGRLGVDVEERIDRVDLDGLSATVFGPDEQADFALTYGAEKIYMFFSLWTLKEAMIKALGLGFSQDPSKFQIPLSMRSGARKSIFKFPNMQNTTWILENLGNSEFAAAIVHELNPATDRL